jgi:hypothetical protein
MADVAFHEPPAVSRKEVSRGSTMSRWNEAAGHFERALERNARMGALPWVAHTQDDYARMLLARDETGDRERAFQLIGEALVTYRGLRMESWAAKASELR